MNTVAVVTGATQGLGYALVEGLAARLEDGDTVYLTGRTSARIAAAAQTLRPSVAQVRTELLDVSDDASSERFAEIVAQRHGGVDIVFSNAYRRVGPGDDPVKVIVEYVDVNNLGTTRVLRTLGPLLRDGGRLLVVASTVGTLHYLPPVLHDRFDDLASLDDVDRAVCRWRDAVRNGRAPAEGWPGFINIPSKVAQVSAVRTFARGRRDEDLLGGRFVAAVCPGMIDTASSRPWFDMSRAQTPSQAAGPLLDLALGADPGGDLYGELVRFGQKLTWAP